MALFNRDMNGSAELRRLTGLWYESNDWDNIAREVEFATAEVADAVGGAVIARAEEIYGAGAPVDGSDDLAYLDAVRLPVAVLAVARFSGQNIVSHEDTGRKLRTDENTKVPFEWMIDRDDRALIEKYYRAMSALYRYLSDNSVPEWTSSEQCARLRRSIVSDMAVFESVYPLDHSWYALAMFAPVAADIQEVRLRRMLGDRYAFVTAASVADGDVPLLNLCRRWLALSAVAAAVRRWGLSVFPLSVARRFSPSYQGNRESSAASTEEMDWYLAKLDGQIAEAAEDIREEIAGSNPYEGLDLLPDNDPANKFFTTQ